MGFTAAEKEHYANMARMIIADGDEDRRADLNKTARQALASVRASLPQADDDDVLVMYFAGVALIMARLLAAPLQDAAVLAESVFNNYTLAAAAVMGVYEMQSGTVPAPPDPAPDAAAEEARRMAEELMNRAYL